MSSPDKDRTSLDVRRVPKAAWKRAVGDAVTGLPTGGVVEIVADGDPIEIWHALEALLAGRFTWEYAEEGPAAWRVRVGKPEGGEASPHEWKR